MDRILNVRESTISRLLDRMSTGWDPDSESLRDFLELWRALFGPANLLNTAENSAYFSCEIKGLLLRGADDTHVLCVSGPDAVSRAKEFVNSVQAPGRMLFILGFSVEVERRIDLAAHRCLVLSANTVTKLFSAEHPKAKMRELILAGVMRAGLVPFNTLLPARSGMFHGREHELQRLRQNDDCCFALIGPGRIGKTSLALRYRELLRIERDKLALSTYFVDCYECSQSTALGFAKFIAKRIDNGSARSRIESLEDFAQFFRYLKSRDGRIPLVILDEVDEMCVDPEMRKQLSALAKLAICRFILCGKANLLAAVTGADSQMADRFEMIRLKALDDSQATHLLCAPFEDLGLVMESRQEIISKVLRLTGNLPHLVQYYGKRLAEYVLTERSDNVIRQEYVEDLKWDFETASFFTSSLEEIKNPKTKIAAYLLLRGKYASVSPGTVLETIRREAIDIDFGEARKICDELVIQNVLSWAKEEGATYRIANEAMPEYAQKLGLLTQGIEELKRLLTSKP
jgi:hypothetical protein